MDVISRYWHKFRINSTSRSVAKGTGKLTLMTFKFFCAYHLFGTYVGGPRIVYGPSMLPTFDAGTEWIWEDCRSIRLGRPLERGELVILDSPREPGGQICKRILGLPGDTVCVDPTAEGPLSNEHVLIPEGHIWVVGDNAAGSIDSRTYGPVPIALVSARVVRRMNVFKRKLVRNNATVIGID